MGQYYGNALCTIAAVSATDSSQGFLNPRPAQSMPVRECSFPALVYPGYDRKNAFKAQLVFLPQVPRWDYGVCESPLYARGWTFQERLLSKRTLYWSEHALFWQCTESHGSEFDHHGRVRQWSFTPIKDISYFLRLPKKQALGAEWHKLIEDYSKMVLTIEDDRLIALYGLSDEIGKAFSDQCLYGHWRSCLHRSLCWWWSHNAPRGPRGTAVRPVPSWSWASAQNPVEFLNVHDDGTLLFEVVDVSGELDPLRVTVEIGSTCRLQILGMVESLRYDSWRDPPHDVSNIYFSSEADPYLRHFEVLFDYFYNWPGHMSGTLLCLPAAGGSDEVHFLVLEKLQQPDTFKRVGWGWMAAKDENTQVKAFPSLLKTPRPQMSLFLV